MHQHHDWHLLAQQHVGHSLETVELAGQIVVEESPEAVPAVEILAVREEVLEAGMAVDQEHPAEGILDVLAEDQEVHSILAVLESLVDPEEDPMEEQNLAEGLEDIPAVGRSQMVVGLLEDCMPYSITIELGVLSKGNR